MSTNSEYKVGEAGYLIAVGLSGNALSEGVHYARGSDDNGGTGVDYSFKVGEGVGTELDLFFRIIKLIYI